MRLHLHAAWIVSSSLAATAGLVWAGPPPVLTVGVGEHVSCALVEGGSVHCWGTNANGRAGLGAVPQSSLPRSVGLVDMVGLSVGTRHACAVGRDGATWCWGQNNVGQVGDGTTEDRLAPVAVPGLREIVEVAAGGQHSCARDRRGEVWCWGHPGSIGHGGKHTRRPTRVESLPPARRLVAGDDVTCAFLERGPPRCWGFNTTGLLDEALGPVLRATASRPIEKATLLAIGFRHACLAAGDGYLYCGGSDTHGQLGDQLVPATASFRWDGGASVTCGWQEEAPRAPSNPLTLGLPAPPPRPRPPPQTRVFPSRRGFGPVSRVHDPIAVAAGDGRTCAVRRGEEVLCWGQTYQGSDWSHRIPTPIPGTKGAIALAVSHEHGCALFEDRTLRCWGYNRSGELGNGLATEHLENTPTVPVRWP